MMLVLTRTENQTICLSGGIRIMVVAINGSQVKIGIDAPDEVKILRGELEHDETRD